MAKIRLERTHCQRVHLDSNSVLNSWEASNMDIDTDKIDEAVLALLYLTLHDGVRAWKSHDWNAMSRLHHKGLILDPVNKAKSVTLTAAGLREAESLFKKAFVR